MIASYFDERLGQLLGTPEESFRSKIASARREGLLTGNEHDDLEVIRGLRDRVVQQLGGPRFGGEEEGIVGRLKTWRVAAEANPTYEQMIPSAEDRLLYVAAVIAVRLKHRAGRGRPLSEPELTDAEAWPPITAG